MGVIAVAIAVAVGMLKATDQIGAAILVGIAGAIAFLVLFAGSEKLVRPLMFVLRPFVWTVQKIIGAVTGLFGE